MYTHRLAYEAFCGPIADNLHVCHKCDSPPCCNPTHLFLGTVAVNSVDMVAKGRSLHGEKHHGVKLTGSDVLAIRERYASGGVTQKMLSDEYGISGPHICSILTGKYWRHVGGPIQTANEIRRNQVRGERAGNARLTSEMVRVIRESRESSAALARRFGVGASTVKRVRAGETWTHV